MNRTSSKFSSRTMVILMAVIGFAVLLLNARAIVSGSNATAAQSPFTSSDNFIFTNASLKGTYAGVLSCRLVAGPVTGPCAVSYLYTADGNGNITNTDATVNINGQSFPNINFPGSYTVSTSGKVSVTVTPINGPLTGVPLAYSNVVTETSGGQITEMRGIGTLPLGAVSTVVEKRIRK